jgi:hypothetical protein
LFQDVPPLRAPLAGSPVNFIENANNIAGITVLKDNETMIVNFLPAIMSDNGRPAERGRQSGYRRRDPETIYGSLPNQRKAGRVEPGGL